MRSDISLTPRESVSIHLPDNMRRASLLAGQGQARRATIVPGQSNLAIHLHGQGAPEQPANILGARERRPTESGRSESTLLLSREELATFKRSPHAFIDEVSTMTAAEEEALKPASVNEPASTASMICSLIGSGALGWMSSFWIGGMVDEAARFADPYVVPHGISAGLLSSVGNPVVGASLAVLVSGSLAGGIRMGGGAHPSPDDANLANLATLRAQKLRAFFSCSPDIYNKLDKAKLEHLKAMTARDETFGSLLRASGAVGRSWLTDDATYLPWHVLLSIGAITAPHLIDSHYGTDLADKLTAAGLRLLYRWPWGVGASVSTALLQHFSRPLIQKTPPPKRGFRNDEVVAANLAALQNRHEHLSIKLLKLQELKLRTAAQILKGERTREDAQPLLDHIDAKHRALDGARLRVQYKMVKLRSGSMGRNWLVIQNLASTLYKGKNKALPPHLKGVLTQSALKIRSVASLLGCCTTLTAGQLFAYFNASQLGPRPDPHVEGITGAEIALVVTNTVVLMELWKLRSPVGRYIFEPALNVGVGLAEGTAKAVSTAFNWCCGRQREDLAAQKGHMQLEQLDLEAPFEQPVNPPEDILSQFTQAADLLNPIDESEPDYARFSGFLDQLDLQAQRDGNPGALKEAFDSLPPETLETIIDCEFLNEGSSRQLAKLARDCLLKRVDRSVDVHEVKGEPDGHLDALTKADRQQIEAYLFDNAVMSNLWPAVHTADPETMRRAYVDSKASVLKLLQRTDPAQANEQFAEEKVLQLLEAFWTDLGQEFPQLVETLFDSLPSAELKAIMARAEALQIPPLRIPAQQSLDGRLQVRNDAAASAFDTEVERRLRSVFAGQVVHRQASAQYQEVIDGIRGQFPGNDVAVRSMLMDSLADLLATQVVSTLQMDRLFSTLSNGELDAIRTYISAPGAQTTRQQGNIMRIARQCLARNTVEQASALADGFVGWIGTANQANYPAGYEEQMTVAGAQLRLVQRQDTRDNRREWLMDSIAFAFMSDRIDEDKLVAVLRSLPSEERALIVTRAAGVHAPDVAYRVTLCARRAATQRREELAGAANVAVQRALEADRDQLPAATEIAAAEYENYRQAVLPGAIEAQFDQELDNARKTLLAHIGSAHDTLSVPANLTRPPT